MIEARAVQFRLDKEYKGYQHSKAKSFNISFSNFIAL